MIQSDSNIMVCIHCLTYNHEPYIRQCLEGFVMQKTKFKFEAIVHDDASTDKTADIIREYAEKYPDIIKPIYETENQYSKHDGSLSRIMNAHMRGEYVAFCEGDDYWIDPLKLQKQVEELKRNPCATMVYTAFQTINQNSEPIYRPFYENYMVISTSGDIFKKLLYRGNYILTVTTCIRKEILDDFDYVNSEIGLDYFLFLYAAMKGNMVYIKEKTSCYRQSPNGLMETQKHYIDECLRKSFIVISDYFLSGKGKKRKLTENIKIELCILERAVAWFVNGKSKPFVRKVLIRQKHLILFLPFVLAIHVVAKRMRNNIDRN